MNPIRFAFRRRMITKILVVALGCGGVLGLNEMRADTSHFPGTSSTSGYLEYLGTRVKQARDYISAHLESQSEEGGEQSHEPHHKILVTNPVARDIRITEPYVCQIHSQRHIEVRALERGYLEQILVKEGQAVKKGDLMFKLVATLYEAKLDAELAEAQLAQIDFNNTKALCDKRIVSMNELAMVQAKLDKANAKAKLAGAEVNFTNIRAPFDGIVDRLREQLGSLIEEGSVLTTLSDNSVMWVYFNVPEARYLEYMADRDRRREEDRVELELANGVKFPREGKIGAIEAKFDNTTGNIPFRADFPNPNGLLRHGQTGTILLSRIRKGATVIPQRAVFEILAKRFVYVVGEDHVVHQREISVEHEQDDIYLIGKGLEVTDTIVLEGVRQVHDGERIEYEFQAPEEVLRNLKHRAE